MGRRRIKIDVVSDEHSIRAVDHTGDAGIEVTAPSRAELMRRALLGMASLMVGGDIRERERRTISIEGADDEDLLHDFLAAALNLFLVDGFIWRDVAVEDRGSRIEAELRGERLDRARHEYRGEIKAVTYHQINVNETNGAWQARVIFDI